jgi:hypothetical protein
MGRRKKSEVKTEAVVETQEAVKPDPEATKLVESTSDKPVSVRVYVADGKCMNCRRGVLKPGTEVFAKDFPGGEDTIAEHIENGGLVAK